MTFTVYVINDNGYGDYGFSAKADNGERRIGIKYEDLNDVVEDGTIENVVAPAAEQPRAAVGETETKEPEKGGKGEKVKNEAAAPKAKIDDAGEREKAQREVEQIASKLEKGNTPKNDELIQRIADMAQEADEALESGNLTDEERLRQQARFDVADAWLENNVRGHRADIVKPVTKREARLRDAIVDLLREAGIDVVTESEEGQRVLDMANGRGVTLNKAQKRILETAPLIQEEGSRADISSIDGAKVLKNLDILAEKLEKSSSDRKNFLQEVGNALNAKQHGSKSQYATFETKNGQIVTIRLGNHNATVSSFDNNGEDNGISIVISRRANQGITNDDNAHLVEYFYSDKAINRAEGKPLADIVRSIKQALYSGEYKDTTGLAEREEVNAEQVRMHRVYHGSGADFERFDHSHLGEGEGAQAFGWGTYVTEVEGIGKKYANDAVGKYSPYQKVEYVGEKTDTDSLSHAKVIAPLFNGGSRDWNGELEFLEQTKESPRTQRHIEWFKKTRPEDWKSANDGKRTLYTVEIPEDNGSNYIEWNEPIKQKQLTKIASALAKENGKEYGDYLKEKKGSYGENIYYELYTALGSQQAASELLHSAGFVGVKYPAEYYSGGRADGAKNYVIFDESDLQITDKVKFFRTENGETYGFTMGGKIYLDPKIATAETPIHEYTHLWAEALRAANPKAWERLKSELEKDKDLMAYVQRLYPEYYIPRPDGHPSKEGTGMEDELMDEVFAHFSGRRGAERLREEQRKAMDEAGDYVEKAGVVAMFERLRDALKKFWNAARDLFAGKTRGIKSRSAEDFADMVLGDLVGGFKPDRGDRVDRSDRERDAEYMEAVNRGDMETAQRMVDEAAKKAGYTIHAFHGTPNNFTEFSLKYLGSSGATHEGYGFYFTDKRDIAHMFATQKGTDGKMYDVYLKIDKPISDTERTITKGQLRTLLTELGKAENEDGINPLSNYGDTDMRGVAAVVNDALSLEDEGNENDIDLIGSIINTTGEMELVFDILRQRLGYDGLIVKNPDWGKKVGQTIYLAFHPDQIKVTDPVTYDDAGNVIPLSKRFNKRNADIRYEKVGGNVRFRGEEEPVFYSNAMRAVENIKQERATPEQWVKMIEKQGGLKAGEDKWLGLSEWLKGMSDRKDREDRNDRVLTLTKQEVMDYIRANEIQVEEVEYADAANNIAFEALKQNYDMMLRDSGYDYAWEQMREQFGDDAEIAFTDVGGELEIANAEAAAALLGSETPINETRLQYTTEGLDNKREIVLTVPTIEPWNEHDEVHFGEAGGGRAVAWARFGETTIPNEEWEKKKIAEIRESDAALEDFEKRMEEKYGTSRYQLSFRRSLSDEEKKTYSDFLNKGKQLNEEYRNRPGLRVLVIDEIQSKRHQEGREKGYREIRPHSRQEANLRKAVNDAQDRYDEYTRKMGEKYGGAYVDIYADMSEEDRKEADRLENAVYEADAAIEKHYSAIPDAPFEKNWHEVAMKRMLRFAAENGYDKVAWTKGEQQAERYNLSSLVSKIEISLDYRSTEERPLYEVFTFDSANNIIDGASGIMNAERLGETFGKELAAKLVAETNKKNGEIATLSGDGLKVGGEGMKGFYDQILPRFMDKYGKKWGVKTGEVELPNLGDRGLTMWGVDVTDDMRESVMRGQPLFRPKTQSREGGEAAARGDWSDRESVERIGEFAGYSPQQVERMSKRQEESARRQFKDAAEKLHLGDRITFVDTIDEIEGMDERTREIRRRKKGWFDPRTGKIVIILGNHRSMDDVMKSIMHEGVAHHGLRQMFGEHFNTFLDNVYQAASPEIRDRINTMAKKHGWDFRTATEEYLATLAEDTDFENPTTQSWWRQVKAWFFDMLHQIGFKLHNAYDTLTDNELRYLLWRSYENLVNPGRYNSFVEEAKDVAKQYELKVGEWDETWSVAAEAKPNATMVYNGKRIPIWATNGRRREDRGDRTDRMDREDRGDRVGSEYNVAADGVAEDAAEYSAPKD